MIGLGRIIKMARSYLDSTAQTRGGVIRKDIIVLDVDYCLYQSAELEKVEAEYIYNQQKALFGTSGDSYESLRQDYGSSKKGMKEKYGLTFEQIKKYDYLDSYKFLRPDPELRRLLREIPLEKYCLTNGFKEKAEKILERLGILDCIVKVYCPDDNDEAPEWILKPFKSAYTFVMEDTNICPEHSKVYFFDDSQLNLNGAKELNWIPTRVSKDFPIHEALKKFIKDYGPLYGMKSSEEYDTENTETPSIGCIGERLDTVELVGVCN